MKCIQRCIKSNFQATKCYGLLWNETDSVSGQLPNILIPLNTSATESDKVIQHKSITKSAEIEGVVKSKFEFKNKKQKCKTKTYNSKVYDNLNLK